MCEPVTIAAATMALTAASSYQQYETGKAQAEMQTEMYERNKANANKAMAQQYNDIGIRQQQEQQAAAQQKEELSRDARAKMATARVAAGASGVSGLSVERGLRDISGAASRDRSNVDQNLDWTMGQLERQKTSVQTGTVGRINSVSKGQAPSKIGLGLDVASAGVNAYGSYQAKQPTQTTNKQSAGTYKGGYFNNG